MYGCGVLPHAVEEGEIILRHGHLQRQTTTSRGTTTNTTNKDIERAEEEKLPTPPPCLFYQPRRSLLLLTFAKALRTKLSSVSALQTQTTTNRPPEDRRASPCPSVSLYFYLGRATSRFFSLSFALSLPRPLASHRERAPRPSAYSKGRRKRKTEKGRQRETPRVSCM